MRRSISYPRLAALAAGAAVVLMLGLAGTAGAGTGGPHSMGSPVYTTSQAGYVAQGQSFRYVATTVTVAPAPVAVFNQSLAEVVLGGSNGAPVTLAVPAGGGANSISYSYRSGTAWQMGHFTNVSPRAGDTLILGIYDQHGRVFLTANDVTQHVSQTIETSAVTAVYNAAEVAGVVNNGTVVSPNADTRLWEFTNTAVTTTAGAHGTLLGPWTTSQVIDTHSGSATSPVVINSPLLWNNGQNFGVWLRATA
jgi:hypothetical protein